MIKVWTVWTITFKNPTFLMVTLLVNQSNNRSHQVSIPNSRMDVFYCFQFRSWKRSGAIEAFSFLRPMLSRYRLHAEVFLASVRSLAVRKCSARFFDFNLANVECCRNSNDGPSRSNGHDLAEILTEATPVHIRPNPITCAVQCRLQVCLVVSGEAHVPAGWKTRR